MEEAKQELEVVIKTVIAEEDACHVILVHIQPKKLQRLLIIEYWANEEVFVGPHMQTAHRQNFLKKAEAFLDGEAEFSFLEGDLSCSMKVYLKLLTSHVRNRE